MTFIIIIIININITILAIVINENFILYQLLSIQYVTYMYNILPRKQEILKS